MSQKEDNINIFSYAGIIKFGKENSKIKLNKKQLILLIISFAIIVALLDYIFGIYF